jgi:hypothetical protein
MRMQTIVAMLPQPEWRGAEIPSLSYLARALADPDVYVFAAFEGKRPMGFVSAYRFPSLAKQSTSTMSMWPRPIRIAAWGAGSWTA